MSAEFVVYFTQSASSNGIEVTADNPEDAIDKAWDKIPGSLCWSCAANIGLDGDWEPESVTDANGNAVWKAPVRR